MILSRREHIFRGKTIFHTHLKNICIDSKYKNGNKQPIKENNDGLDRNNLMMKCFVSMVCLSEIE